MFLFVLRNRLCFDSIARWMECWWLLEDMSMNLYSLLLNETFQNKYWLKENDGYVLLSINVFFVSTDFELCYSITHWLKQTNLKTTSTQFQKQHKKCRKYFLCGEIIFQVYLQITEISRCFCQISLGICLFVFIRISLPLVRLSLKTFLYFFNLGFLSVFSFHKQFNFTWFCCLMFVLQS